ncbi:alpha/beta fold hydrolase [Tsukamurella pseudospumae]|uniref:Hydrolase n=1 Tax=Tsukamurella pseudospumae TaxID=239498 RepID=A0A138AUB3_9ACTN|nr:hydrolase [Tsukamurella pseudospumae]KXP14041.1 hydrolase [Tsukamurella pseudospumae]
MLHGIGGSSETFAGQFAGIGGLHLLAWDAPGYARSDDPAEPLDLDDYADAAADVIRSRCADGAHVLGMSWGGVIAVRLALRHPDLVRSLILGDSTVGSGTSPESAAAMRARADELGAHGAPAFAAARAPRLLAPGADDDAVSAAADLMAASIRLPGYGYAAESMAATDHTEALAGVATPTLVLCGDEDRITGRDASQALAGGIPDGVFVTVRGAGHLANQEQPEAFNAWTESFVQITELLLTR